MRFWRRVSAALAAFVFIMIGAVAAYGDFDAKPAALPTTTIVHVPDILPASQLLAVSEASVVMLSDPLGHGSGVHLGQGYIVTAAHVADGKATMSVKTNGGKQFDADVLWVNKTYDIALLRTSGIIPGKSSLDCRQADVGEEIQAAGNPLNIEFVSSFGHIAGGARKAGRWESVLITDITIVMGQSGGPVFDSKGRVIGITVGVAAAPLQSAIGFIPSLTGFGMVVPSSEVCMLLGKGAV